MLLASRDEAQTVLALEARVKWGKTALSLWSPVPSAMRMAATRFRSAGGSCPGRGGLAQGGCL